MRNKAQKNAVTAPLSQTEKAEESNESSLFRLAFKVIADCKSRDHVRHFTEVKDGRTQTANRSKGLGLVLSKEASDEVKARQKAVSGLELFVDSLHSLFKTEEIDDSILHLRKLIKTLETKQKEVIDKLATEKQVSKAMK
jgi:hypothetical protein